MRPVMPRKTRTAAVVIPAAIIWGTVRGSPGVIATEAMAFIGCTGIGTPNTRPGKKTATLELTF
jgi:hypothetical protein